MEVSELYHVYEKDFVEGCQRLQKMTASQQNMAQLEELIKALTTTQKQLDVELCMLPTNIKANHDKTLKPFKKLLNDKRAEVKRFRATEEEQVAPEQRNFHEKSQQNERLCETKRLLYNMESISDSISDTLAGQTERMLGIKGKNQQIVEQLNKANGLLDSIWFKQKKNKLVLGALAALIVLLILYRLW